MGNLISPPADTRLLVPPRFHTRGLTRPVEFEDPMSIQFGSMFRREVLCDLHSFRSSFGLDIALSPEVPVTTAARIFLGGSTKSRTVDAGALNLHFNAELMRNLSSIGRLSLDHATGIGGFGMLTYGFERGRVSAIGSDEILVGFRAESAHVLMGLDVSRRQVPTRGWCIWQDSGVSLGVAVDASNRVEAGISIEKSIPHTDSWYCVSAKRTIAESLIIGFSQHLVTHRKVYNPFEESQWIANYIDIGLEAERNDAKNTTHISAGASWQPNKNVLTKLHASTLEGLLVTLAVRNWWLPNVLASVSAGLDTQGQPCLGGRLQIANWVPELPEYELGVPPSVVTKRFA